MTVRTQRPRPVVLCILDGWGVRENGPDNAIALAATPNERTVAPSSAWSAPLGLAVYLVAWLGLKQIRLSPWRICAVVAARRPAVDDAGRPR